MKISSMAMRDWMNSRCPAIRKMPVSTAMRALRNSSQVNISAPNSAIPPNQRARQAPAPAVVAEHLHPQRDQAFGEGRMLLVQRGAEIDQVARGGHIIDFVEKQRIGMLDVDAEEGDCERARQRRPALRAQPLRPMS